MTYLEYERRKVYCISSTDERNLFHEIVDKACEAIGVKAECWSYGRGPEMIGIWTVRYEPVKGPPTWERIRIPKEMHPRSEEAFNAILTHMKTFSPNP